MILLVAFYCSHTKKSIHQVFKRSLISCENISNGRKHGDQPKEQGRMDSFIDKQVRNRIDSLRGGGSGRYNSSLKLWFDTIFGAVV